ncbi:hypothetical protein KA001_01385 [Patescibacteria group bacterium]|nr:hypothetical protein [Patescibacteria group bacterium]
MIDFLGFFILISGLIIGLGAVIVIDIHGFLGIKSSYWTQATTRTHKVTKPLIWVGIVLLIIGEIIIFRNNLFSITPIILFTISSVLILNGIFLSFFVSPYMLNREKQGRDTELLPKSWQNKITISLIFSDLGWWSTVAIIAHYISTK